MSYQASTGTRNFTCFNQSLGYFLVWFLHQVHNANMDLPFMYGTGSGLLSCDHFSSTAQAEVKSWASIPKSMGWFFFFFPLFLFIEAGYQFYTRNLSPAPCYARTQGFLLLSCPSFITPAQNSSIESQTTLNSAFLRDFLDMLEL